MKELEKELYEIVYKYSIENKIADEEFVVDVMDLCINSLKINDYVKAYEVNEINNNNVYAGYDLSDKYLLFNLRSTINGAYERIQEEKEIGIKSNRFLDCFKINSTIVNGIIFQLTNASFYKNYIEDRNTFENKILGLGLDRNVTVLENKQIPIPKVLYYKMLDRHFQSETYYNACPNIRMSGIKAAEVERNIAKLLDQDLKENIEEYTELRLLNSKIITYADYAPTSFIRTVNEHAAMTVGLPSIGCDIKKIEDMYKEKAEKYNLSYDERIWLGLPITLEERGKEYQKRSDLQYILTKKD